MHPIIGHIGGVTIYSHGLLIILGVIVGGLIMYDLIKRSKLPTDNFIDNLSTVVLVGVIGARLAYVIIYYKELQSFAQAFYIWQGGLVSWGGFILGALTLILMLRYQKQPILKWLDIFGIAGMAGITIGRIGCVMAGDILGKVSQSYPSGFPVASSEVVLTLLLTAVLVFVFFRYPKLSPGIIFYEAIAGYSLIRFVLDGYRDAPNVLWGLGDGQLTAGIVLLLTIIFFVWQYLIRRKNG